jgi:CRISPR-associated protein Csm2
MVTNMKIEANRIIAKGEVEILVDTAKQIGQELARQLTTSQIRNIFGEVRRIEMNWRAETEDDAKEAYRKVVLLQPKMAYQARRERGRGVEMLQEVLDPCIEEIRKAPEGKRKEYFTRFF